MEDFNPVVKEKSEVQHEDESKLIAFSHSVSQDELFKPKKNEVFVSFVDQEKPR